ncbi:MAG: 4-(cytidine 5'-diphospho)-2-C-methyl-D-erythritol kinase [Candidatus Omnitrophica bacterium]|nr:4-(cytidine 5'-diphospho)-2-C-methyl-D-erythritol kinase [Candidatus Omnitrophota bacterium]MCF7893452.1 4-(cytidine 5'-diphospho)-2-C-methyl-D-erythritol kinase [Candidatus Omnitrophota bacterium]
MDSQLIISQKKQKNSYHSKIELLSPAKINLYLNIVGKSGGYHRLESIAERISLFDKISIKIKPGSSINISSNNKQLETKKNLCYKAAKLIKDVLNIPFGFDICLEKNIPIGSGLGGGSSNAAFTLLGIKQLLALDISRDDLYRMGQKLGSDVNFFLADAKFAYLSGRGQIVEPLPSKIRLKHFIIWPKTFVSTKVVYKNSKAKLTRFFSNVNMLKYSLKNKDYFLIKKGIYNHLEKSAFSLCNSLANLKEALIKRNIFSAMSGSGSAFYTLGSEKQSIIKTAVPDKWILGSFQTF